MNETPETSANEVRTSKAYATLAELAAAEITSHMSRWYPAEIAEAVPALLHASGAILRGKDGWRLSCSPNEFWETGAAAAAREAGPDDWPAIDRVNEQGSPVDASPIRVPTREETQQIIDEPGYVYRAGFDTGDVDEDMRELPERFAHQEETRAAVESETAGAMDDDGMAL